MKTGRLKINASIRSLPPVQAFEHPKGLECLPSADALARFDAGVRAADEGADNAISIYDMIGDDPWDGSGTTAKRISAALRSIGDKDVVVNINSPGGDLFEGLAIYNLLRAHPKKVTVRVMGMAASAASVVAMAGDEIQIARAGFFMVHNGWVIAMGNRHDMREVADFLEPFDAAMADVYAARTGLKTAAVAELMDAESWINAKDAIKKGFADDYVPADQIKENAAAKAAAKNSLATKRVDVLLAKSGIPRDERRSLIAGVKSGTLRATEPVTPSADGLAAADVQRAYETLLSLSRKD